MSNCSYQKFQKVILTIVLELFLTILFSLD